MYKLKNKAFIFTMSLFENKYKIIEKIGGGTGGIVFKAKHIFKDELCAIKIEIKNKANILCREAQFYRYLEKMGNTMTSYSEYLYPKLRSIGTNENYNYMVMDLLDKSLEDIQKERSGFTLKTSLLITIQMIQLLKTIHYNYIIHRDIKPSNFVFGYKNGAFKLHLIDFGLCVYGKNGEIYNLEKKKNFIGNLKYASYNAILNRNPEYRDDIESVIYIMIELCLGTLPWLDKNFNEKKNWLILKKKNPNYVYDYCKKNYMPYHLLRMIHYVLFSKKQFLNYDYILLLLRNQLYELNYKEDYQYDWLDK